MKIKSIKRKNRKFRFIRLLGTVTKFNFWNAKKGRIKLTTQQEASVMTAVLPKMLSIKTRTSKVLPKMLSILTEKRQNS